MDPGEGGEDVGSVRDGSELSVLMFVPDQRVPVEEEDEGGGEGGGCVLGEKVVGDLPPGQLPHHRQGHREGGVEETARHPATDQETQEYSNRPTTSNINQSHTLTLSYQTKRIYDCKVFLSSPNLPSQQLRPHSPEIDREEVPLGVDGEDGLGQGAVPDDDEDEGAKELGQELPHRDLLDPPSHLTSTFRTSGL